ncbi:DNA-directed RNA polymerase specialized sigma subunit, sigma24 family [Gracilibacillus ureilyticus]|uniref:DNA-directed RNA polymerase specialized sigma subunit, sigma24 family n=1 Tax=Gracilibacillus ureilyticus TaxID=531814 RepID=A0A1H9V2X6_9BACI|nr:hypothetical protein [Gracilibacillus ureilyticus]SES15929.1 DNA-directed RNA polymerase specialized sigma subunit, sigma24 family [Gracilibacillus ureilyticus]
MRGISLPFYFTDKRRLKEFVKKHKKDVYQLCFLITGDAGAAEKIAMDIFTQLYRDYPSREWNPQVLYENVKNYVGNSLLVKRVEVRERSHDAIMMLPVHDRLILGLASVSSLSIDEISSIFQVSRQHVTKSLYQSREFLLKQNKKQRLKLLS